VIIVKKAIITFLIVVCLLIPGCTTGADADISGQFRKTDDFDPLTASYSEILEYTQGNHVHVDREYTEIWEKPVFGDVVEIQEKYFIQQFNDMYANPDEYNGKTIKFEGMLDMWQDFQDESVTHYIVYRKKTSACCGAIDRRGLYIEYDGEKPDPDDWVAVEGILKIVDYESGMFDMVLADAKMTVKPPQERGEDIVYN